MTKLYLRNVLTFTASILSFSLGLLMTGPLLFLATGTSAQANCAELPCGAHPNGNGPGIAQAKLYCSNSGKVDNGIIACTPAADTDGCGIDASKNAVPTAALAQWLLATSANAYQTGMHVQWIRFYTPEGVNAFKIQGVGKSDAWVVYWHKEGTTADPAPAQLKFIKSSTANQWATMENPDAALDKVQTYYIAFFYKKPSNGSINFKVKECESLCTPSITCPTAITIHCDPQANHSDWANQVQIQNCNSNTTLNILKSQEPFSCEQGQITNYSFQLVNAATSSVVAACQSTITAIDTLAPVMNALPENLIEQCGQPADFQAWLANHGGASATDACTSVTWTYTIRDGAACGKNVTFIATDACGNSVTASALYQPADNSAPVLNQPAENLVLDCSNNANHEVIIQEWLQRNGGATFSDACASNLTHSHNYPGTPQDCKQEITFIASDACGNSATTIAYISYAGKGSLEVIAPPVDLIWTCDENDQNILQQWLAVQGAAQVQSACGELSWSHDFIGLNPGCGKQSITFTGTSSCGAVVTLTASIIRQDNTPPSWERHPQSVSTECDANATDYVYQGWLENHGGAIVNDACGDLTWRTTVLEESPGACPGTFSRKVLFWVTDACGNTSSAQATFTVVDAQAPYVIKEPEALYLQCNEPDASGKIKAWMDQYANAMIKDDCSQVTWNVPQLKSEPTCQQAGEAEFTFTDQCGNSGSFTAYIYIQDQEPPAFTTLPKDVSVLCDGEGNLVDLDRWISTLGGSVATDACGQVTVAHNYPGQEDGCSRTLTFTATDACGNVAEASATFTIIDSIAPAITQPATPLQVSCGQDQVIQDWLENHGGAKATDNCGEVQWTNDYNGQIKNCKATVTFTATDACGNVSNTSADITFLDAQPPVLENPATPMTVECDGSGNQGILQYWLGNHGGAIATDACGPVEWSDDFQGLQPLCGQTAQVTVNFTATDGCGNSISTSATFTIEDTTPPFLLNGQDYTATCNDPSAIDFQSWLDQNANFWVIEDCSEVTFEKEIITTTFGCGQSWQHQVKFTATDACGNSSTEILTYKYLDNQGPDLQLPENYTINCNPDYLQQYETWKQNLSSAIQASDACSEVNIQIDAPSSPLKCGATAVNIVATDACGNSTTGQVYFEIKDDAVPVFVKKPTDITVACSADPDGLENWLNLHGGAEANDACTSITWTTQRQGKSDCMEMVRFIATDACGNSASEQATIYYQDTNAPVILQTPADLTLECGTDPTLAIAAWLNANGGANAQDDCSAIAWSNDYQSANNYHCNQPTTVTFTVADACGNTTTVNAKIVSTDNQKPVIVQQPQSLTLHCEDPEKDIKIQSWINNYGGAIAQDACTSVTWKSDPLPVIQDCGDHTIAWTAADQCGNVSIVTATLSIIDVIPPQGNCPDLTHTVKCLDASTCQGPAENILLQYADLISTHFTDNCSQPQAHVIPSQVANPTNIAFEIVDDCGNKATLNCTLKLIYEYPPINNTGYCTFTQGGWGNAGGYFPTKSPENSRPAIIRQLLAAKGALTIGKDGRSITFTNEHCIINALPGNGGNVPLAPGNITSSYPDCYLGTNSAANSGRLDNNLATNTVALTLNVWYNEVRNGTNLSTFQLDAGCLTLPSNIRQELFNQNLPLTVGGFLELSNRYLGGKLTNVSGSFGGSLTNFTTTLNEYWHECKSVPQDCALAPLNELQLAPNPAESFTTVQYTSGYATTGQLTLLNTTSQVLHQEKITVTSGSNIYQLQLDQYPSGWYFIQLTTISGEALTKTIFIE